MRMTAAITTMTKKRLITASQNVRRMIGKEQDNFKTAISTAEASLEDLKKPLMKKRNNPHTRKLRFSKSRVITILVTSASAHRRKKWLLVIKAARQARILRAERLNDEAAPDTT
mmetsp:Transcript_20195/g.36504  ORF Transcript_20195/g.36504 Transcript_20195/m.36504 type:complete len:114 (+) Transcript_20195:692-1033(+)